MSGCFSKPQISNRPGSQARRIYIRHELLTRSCCRTSLQPFDEQQPLPGGFARSLKTSRNPDQCLQHNLTAALDEPSEPFILRVTFRQLGAHLIKASLGDVSRFDAVSVRAGRKIYQEAYLIDAELEIAAPANKCHTAEIGRVVTSPPYGSSARPGEKADVFVVANGRVFYAGGLR